ncbi:MAG: glycosyltransferase family 2 protein [Nevskiales bacterium]
MLDLITPLVLTYNEAPNLGRALMSLAWARRIVVVDSGSSDETLKILAGHRAVEVFHRDFDSFAAQTHFGLEKIATPFTLSLDADYVLMPALVEEIRQLDPASADAWYAGFVYCVQGKPLRATLLPPRLVLHRTQTVRYVNDGHAHRAVPPARVARLKGRVLHDDRKPLSRWMSSQIRYSKQEADKLAPSRWQDLSWPDRCRRLLLGPLLVPLHCFVFKGLFLDGYRGLHYTFQRTIAEVLLALRLLDRWIADDHRE